MSRPGDPPLAAERTKQDALANSKSANLALDTRCYGTRFIASVAAMVDFAGGGLLAMTSAHDQAQQPYREWL